MSGPGAALRGYNAELREGLAELRARREELSGRIREEEAERNRLQGRIWALTERLARTSESLARHLAARGELDRTIAETEAAYGKVPPARPRGHASCRCPGPGRTELPAPAGPLGGEAGGCLGVGLGAVLFGVGEAKPDGPKGTGITPPSAARGPQGAAQQGPCAAPQGSAGSEAK
ncbi:microtubule nucleation factor SSNA1 isoform 3-T3 [Ciconia maguari]